MSNGATGAAVANDCSGLYQRLTTDNTSATPAGLGLNE